MIRRAFRLPPILWAWLLVLTVSIGIISQTRFTADLSAFLPAQATAEQTFLVDQIRAGSLSRMILVSLSGGTLAERTAASRALGNALRADPLFSQVQNGDSPSAPQERALLLRYRYLLSPQTTPAEFTAEGLHAALAQGIDLLASPFGTLWQPLYRQDPTGALFGLLQQTTQQNRPRQHDGVWVSPSGDRALLMLQTRADGSDTDAMAAALAAVRQQFQAIPHAPALQLAMTGAPVFSVESREIIKTEVHWFSLIGSSAVFLLLWLVYRSLPQVLLGLLPVLTGVLVAIAAVSLGFGTVHGITIGFGTTLIGEAVDYSIYYFIHRDQSPQRDRTSFWPTVRLGVLTSITGFAALLFSGFPGLAQIGLYSMAGLVAAALVTRFVLPALDRGLRPPPADQPPVLDRAGARLIPWVHRLRRTRWLWLILSLLAALWLISQHDRLWQSGLSGLNPIPAQAQQLDATLRRDLHADSARYLLVLTAADADAALAQAERAGQVLAPWVARGALRGFDSPAQWLPSRATQQVRQAALPSAEALNQALGTALVGLPVKPATLAPFVADIEASRHLPLLTQADYAGTDLGFALDNLLTEQHGRWHALIRLHPATAQPLDVAALREALQAAGITHALVIDMDHQSRDLFDGYLHDTQWLSLIGFGAITLLLALALRQPQRLLRVLSPLVMAVVLVMAGLLLAGKSLNILNLIGLLLIVAIGSNYALFFNQGQSPAPRTLAALALANLTTVIAFGTLAFSSLPILNAFGSTVAPGAVLALWLAAAFSATEAHDPDANDDATS
ncbi:MMPL family transporter [Halothiobacillus sp. DCM-1]|uniref:MMPL family transporter n=1 Tax=Halothiobacillus sp. DCM-1 TaxID=3112558 RepID=UPI003249F0F2